MTYRKPSSFLFVLYTFFFSVVLLTACEPQLPSQYEESDRLPKIYPDYIDVTIPANIAPLSFELDEEADEMVARYSVVGDASERCNEIICADKMQPDLGDWHALIAAASPDPSEGGEISDAVNPLQASPSGGRLVGAIQVDVFARHGDRWTHYKPFHITVSPDSIDPWLSYRLIPPSYISYEALTISQRCLENYDERVIYDNILCGKEKDGQCINCHNYQQYNPERMQFHARQTHGGTIIAYDGELKKVNMRNDSILSAGVYPAWHPWLKFIVYSTDKTVQNFQTTDRNKIEVYDTASDLIAYDIDSGEVTNIENDSTEFEVFPAWAPDGRTLYYCSAHFERNYAHKNVSSDIISRIDTLRYSLYRKSFDPETMQFGPRELVVAAPTNLPPLGEASDAVNPLQAWGRLVGAERLVGAASAVLPRVSPDGRYLLFTVAGHGYFHIWHHDADLWLLDLQTGEARSLDEVNSPDTESYHTWSSNGRWIVFSSRRDDGVFTRPFFAHFDGKGHFSKPFELPVADPNFHRQFMKCYNIPELMHGPVIIDPHTFADKLKGEAEPVKYVQKLTSHKP